MGTGELSHNCGGSFANTEMFTMCSAQLQSIKNAVNTYKVSFAIFASNTKVEAQPRGRWVALPDSLIWEVAQMLPSPPFKCHPQGSAR